jgi:hypothetical protein
MKLTNHLLISVAEVENVWSYSFTPPYVFMTQCLITKHQQQFYFSLSHMTSGRNFLSFLSTGLFKSMCAETQRCTGTFESPCIFLPLVYMGAKIGMFENKVSRRICGTNREKGGR